MGFFLVGSLGFFSVFFSFWKGVFLLLLMGLVLFGVLFCDLVVFCYVLFFFWKGRIGRRKE